ncbi:hypothetical protein Tco_0373262 [Tanacetum coccineum]
MINKTSTHNRADNQLYKFKEGDFPDLHLNEIEDMLLLLTQNKLFNLNGDVIVHLRVDLRMFTRGIVLQSRVEDVQLDVESYQRKINLTRPLRSCPGMRFTPLRTRCDDKVYGADHHNRTKQWKKVVFLMEKKEATNVEREKENDGWLLVTMEILPELTPNKLCGREQAKYDDSNTHILEDSILLARNSSQGESPLNGILPDHRSEVVKLKNFKNDVSTSFQDKEEFEHVGPKVTKITRCEDYKTMKRLCLDDDLKEVKDHSLLCK